MYYLVPNNFAKQNIIPIKWVRSKSVNTSIFWIIFSPLILYYYLGDYRIVSTCSYLMSSMVIVCGLRWRDINNFSTIILLLLLLFQISVTITAFDSLLYGVISFRLNFGVIILSLGLFYIYKPNVKNIAIFLSIITFIEFVAIKTSPELIYILENYDSSYTIERARDIFGGIHSFGGNRTVSSVILLSLFAYLNDSGDKTIARFLPLISSLIIMSGTALALTFLYLIFYLKPKYKVATIIVLLVLVFYLPIFSKFNAQYISLMFEDKMLKINNYMSSLDLNTLFFGFRDSFFIDQGNRLLGYSSNYADFAILDFLSRFGLFGGCLFMYFLYVGMDRNNKAALILLFLGTFHYHVIFSGPGQIVAALLWSQKQRFFRFRV
jgi:hypothetical protein